MAKIKYYEYGNWVYANDYKPRPKLGTNIIVTVTKDTTSSTGYISDYDNITVENAISNKTNILVKLESDEAGRFNYLPFVEAIPQADGKTSYVFGSVIKEKQSSVLYNVLVFINYSNVEVFKQEVKVGADIALATGDKIGGIKADPATAADTQPVRIGIDGKLVTTPGSGGGSGGAFIVNVTQSETTGDNVADKTFAEITEAYNASKIIVAICEGTINNLFSINSLEVVFTNSTKIVLGPNNIESVVGESLISIDNKNTVQVLISPLFGLPKGGTAGQVLAKNTNKDFHVKWIDPPSGGGGSGGSGDGSQVVIINGQPVVENGQQTIKLDKTFQEILGYVNSKKNVKLNLGNGMLLSIVGYNNNMIQFYITLIIDEDLTTPIPNDPDTKLINGIFYGVLLRDTGEVTIIDNTFLIPPLVDEVVNEETIWSSQKTQTEITTQIQNAITSVLNNPV